MKNTLIIFKPIYLAIIAALMLSATSVSAQRFGHGVDGAVKFYNCNVGGSNPLALTTKYKFNSEWLKDITVVSYFIISVALVNTLDGNQYIFDMDEYEAQKWASASSPGQYYHTYIKDSRDYTINDSDLYGVSCP